MAPLGRPRGSRQHHARGAPAQMPGTQPRRERLAVHARQLALEPGVRLLHRPCRPLLRGLEQAHRAALDDHVHRPTRVGQWVLISGSWYKIVSLRHVIEMAQRNDVEIWTSTFTLAEVFKRRCGDNVSELPSENDTAFEDYIEQDFVQRVQVDVDV